MDTSTRPLPAHGFSMGLLSASLLAMLLAGCGEPAAPPARQVASTDVVAVRTPPPQYPAELACNDIGGQSVLGVTIQPDGSTGNIRVVSSSGNAVLDQAARDAVGDWQFRAATVRGKPVSSNIQVPVTFRPPQLRPDVCFQFDEQRNRNEL
ncbi:MAG: energy transducer TonB [Pseudomonadota bacterium]|nr:energy transducer TonB [Pseudomonadota bacterium]